MSFLLAAAVGFLLVMLAGWAWTVYRPGLRRWWAWQRLRRLAAANKVCRKCSSCQANLGPCVCDLFPHCRKCGHHQCR